MRFGAPVLRLELTAEGRDGAHELTVGFQPGESKRFTVDGAPVERLADASVRPLVSVFMPDRLELVAGTPSLRRAHLDQVVTALWPSRAGTRRSYAAALAQRNALVGAIRAGRLAVAADRLDGEHAGQDRADDAADAVHAEGVERVVVAQRAS